MRLLTNVEVKCVTVPTQRVGLRDTRVWWSPVIGAGT